MPGSVAPWSGIKPMGVGEAPGDVERLMSDASITSVRLQQHFGAAILAQHTAHGDDTLVVKREAWREIMRFLRDDWDLRYDFLMDLTAVDYLVMGHTPR